MRIIDTHIHGAFGVNFNTSAYEEIKFALKKLYQRGIIAICPTLVGDSFDNLYERLKIFQKIKEESLYQHSYIIGVHLEGTFLNPKKPGIQNPLNFAPLSVENFKSLAQDLEKIIKIVTLAPELDTNCELTNYLENANIRAQAGHTQAQELGNVSGTTHHFNAMPQILHRGENLTLDALVNDKIYCEIIADCVHTGKNMLKLFLRAKNTSKIIFVSDALPVAHSERDMVFCGKKILTGGKDENGTIAGSILLLDEILNNAVNMGLIDEKLALLGAFYNPLKHLNLSCEEIEKITQN